MSLVDKLDTAMSDPVHDLPGDELLPERLTRACAEVLPVYGAGISLRFDTGRHVPLGASNPASTEIERQQFTTGEGPCLASQDSGAPVVASESTLSHRWPGFFDAVATRTPVRSIITLPLPEPLWGMGALDLYIAEPHGLEALSPVDALTTGAYVTAALHQAGSRLDPYSGLPAWSDTPPTRRRSRVWQAMGLVMGLLDVPAHDALSILRARAYAGGSSIDELAAQLVSGEVRTESLALDSDECGPPRGTS